MKRLICRIRTEKTFVLLSRIERKVSVTIPTTLLSPYAANLGLIVTISYWLHDYKGAGSTDPLYGSVCSTDTFI
jgi:hypothetical protein